MAQTTYNASVAYNAPIRYDGVTADVTPPAPSTGGGGSLGPKVHRPFRKNGRVHVRIGLTWQTSGHARPTITEDDELALMLLGAL